MSSPAEILSILVNAQTQEAVQQLTKFDKQLDAVRGNAVRGIEARLGATVDSSAFQAYQDHLGKAARRAGDRAAFKAELGANFNNTAFNAYFRAAEKARAQVRALAAEEAQAAAKRSAEARATLRSVGRAAFSGSGGVSERSAVREARGALRGAVHTGGAFLGGGLLGFVSVRGIQSAIDSTKELAKETRYLTDVTGMDAKTGAEWTAVAQSRNISAAQLNVAFRTLSKVADSALTGAAKAGATVAAQGAKAQQTLALRTEAALRGHKSEVQAFQALGISYRQVLARQHDMAALTDLVTSKLAAMRDGVLKTSVAHTLLGSSSAKAASGANASADAFKRLGITQQDLAKYSHDVSGLMGLIADRLNKIPGGAQRAALEAKLFGRNAAALQPIIEGGSQAMEEQRKQAAAYGVVLGGNAAANTKKLEEASYSLKLAQIALSVQFSEHVAPALTKAATGGIKLATTIGHDLTPAFREISPVVKDVGHWLSEHRHEIELAAAAYAGLRVVRTVGGWFGGLYNDVRRVGRVFGALKTVTTDGLGALGRQKSETMQLAESMNKLAASTERAVIAQRELAGSSAGGLIPPGVKEAERATGTAARTAEREGAQIAEGGVLARLLGRGGAGRTAAVAADAAKLADAAKVAGVTAEGAKVAGLLGKLGPALGGVAKFAGPIGVAVTAFQGADEFISTHGNLGERLAATLHGLTFGLVGNDPTNAQQRAQGAHRANVSFGGFQTDRQGFLTPQGLSQDAARLASLQRQLYSVQHPAAVATRTGMVAPPVDTKVVLDREAQIRQLQRLTNAEQKAALAAAELADRQGQSIGRWSNVNAQLAAITPHLDKLTGKWQDAGALSAIKYARGLELQGRLPVGSTNKIIAAIEAKYPQLATYLTRMGADSMQALADQFTVNRVQRKAQTLVDSLRETFGWMPKFAQTAGDSTQAKLLSAEGELRRIIRTGTKAQRDAARPLLAQLVAEYGTYMAALERRTRDAQRRADRSITALGGNWRNLGSVVSTVVNGQIIPSINSALGPIDKLLGGVSHMPSHGRAPAGRPTHFSGAVVTKPGYFAGEEAPRHPEVVIATNPAYRQRNLGLWQQAGKMLGVKGFQAGGWPTPPSHHRHHAHHMSAGQRAAERAQREAERARRAAERAAVRAAEKAARERQKLLDKVAGYGGYQGSVQIPSQSVAAQVRDATLSNALQAAQNAGDTGRQQRILDQQLKFERALLGQDNRRLASINRELLRHLSAFQHAKVESNKLALLQDIGSIQGNIGSTMSAQSSLGSGGSSSGTFDLAPTGASVRLPTLYDIRRLIAANVPPIHVTVPIHVAPHHSEKDIVEKAHEGLDKARPRLRAQLRAAGLRGT